MSRISYVEWNDGNWGLITGRWLGSVRNATHGARGQAALRELEAALLALPSKRLIAGELCNNAGAVCALGALARYRGISDAIMQRATGGSDGYPGEARTAEWAQDWLNMSFTLAWLVQEYSDIACSRNTPEERYARFLIWVRQWIEQKDRTMDAYKRECLP